MEHQTSIPLASITTRLSARMVDGLFFVIPFLVLIIIGFIADALNAGFRASVSEHMLVFIPVFGILTVIIFNVYYLAKEGQSIGKRLFDIRIVDVQTRRVTGLEQTFFTRSCLNYLLGAIPFYGIIDMLCIFSAQRRCLHDLLARTIVLQADDSQLTDATRASWRFPSILTVVIALPLAMWLSVSLSSFSITPPEKIVQRTEALPLVQVENFAQVFTASGGLIFVGANNNWNQISAPSDAISLFLQHSSGVEVAFLQQERGNYKGDGFQFAENIVAQYQHHSEFFEHVSGPSLALLDGFAAVRYRYNRSVGPVTVATNATFLETTDRLYQILFHTRASDYPTHVEHIQELLDGVMIERDL